MRTLVSLRLGKMTATHGKSTGVSRLCLGMVSIPRQEGLGRTASTLIKQNHNPRPKTLCKIHSGASIKPQPGVQDELKIQEHRTVERPATRGDTYQRKRGGRSTEERAFEDHAG